MRDDDVRLSSGERAAFEDLARRWRDGAPGPRRPRFRGRWLGGRGGRWALAAVGTVGLLVGLLLASPLVGAAAFIVLLVAIGRLTRRWNAARLVLWWRRRPPPADHMWEP